MMAGPVQFNTPPPPIMPNLSVPPPMAPPMGPPPTSMSSTTHQPYFHSFHNRGGGHRNFFQPFRPYPRPGPPGAAGLDEFDGKRLRKSVMRKTVDYNAAIIKMLEARVWQRDFRDRRALQPDVLFYPNLEPPSSYVDNAINAVVTRFVKTATNKMRCPIFCMAWTPEGRRLVTGASSGEFTLWNGLTFNFETILQAHDSPVRTMVWSHNDVWMVTGDHAGYVKYWQSNMNNVKMFQAHKEAIRGLSFSPTDQKFVTCSDDGTLRIWDFGRCFEERILRGHGADVKCVHWHPQKSLIISGSKDNQQPVKLWDPKSGSSMATLHAHKSTVMDIKWNENGNWLVTASRDHLLKLFDIRNLSQEVQTFRGHKKEASSVAWHPYHEGLFCSGGSDGAILFWHVGADKEVGGIEQAHDSIVWTLAWHPLGHILCSGSNDHTSKFWTRNRPGDQMRDKYNLNTLPAGLAGTEDIDIDDTGIIPGMGPEDRVEQVDLSPTTTPATIPGLDFEGVEDKTKAFQKKVPYSKPIPRNFVAQWNETVQEDQSGGEDEDSHPPPVDPALAKMLATILEKTTVQGCIPVPEITPQAIIVYGKLLPVEDGDVFASAIASGSEALHELILSGALEELDDVRPYYDDRPDFEYSPDNMDIDHMPDIEYPHPLPSSMFAKKGGPVAQPLRKSRFSDAEPGQMNAGSMDPGLMGDKDMRGIGGFLPNFPFSSGDQDLRMDPNFAQNQHDEDLRILMDIDRREEEMMKNNQISPFGGPPDGPFGLPGMGDNQMGLRDVDARHMPFNVEQGNWHQQPPPQHWGPGDPIRPGLNNFGTRNFVSSGNFQNQSGNFPNSSNDSPGNNNYGNDIGGPNAFGSNYSNSNQDNYVDDEDQYDESWAGPNSQGSPMDRSQMGPRPQMVPGQHMGPRPMDHRLNMDPRQMGPNGPQMGQRPIDPNQRIGIRPPMGPGGPQMNQRPPIVPRGPPMGSRGPQMGPRGPQMGPRGPLINQRPGPGGIQMDHRRSQDPRNSQANHGGSLNEHSPTDSQMDTRGVHLGQGIPQNLSGQQMGPRGTHLGPQDSSMVHGGPPMRQDLPGGPQMGQRISHRDSGGRPMGPGDPHRDQGPHMVPGDNLREPPPMGPGGLQRDHRHQMGPGDTHRDQRHQMGPGDSHRDTGGPAMGPGGPQRDHRHQIGPGDTHRDQRHQMGPSDSLRDQGGPPMGPGGPQRERHPMGPSDRGPGGPQRERHQVGPGDSHREPGGPPMGPSGPQRERHPMGPSDRGPGGLPLGPSGPQRERHPGGPGELHREPGGPPMGPAGLHRDRDQRHQMGPGDSLRDQGGPAMGPGGPQRDRHQIGPGDSLRDQGGPAMGPGGPQRDRHQIGPGDSLRDQGGPAIGPGGPQRERHQNGPGDSLRDQGGPTIGPGGPQRERHQMGPSDRGPGGLPIGPSGPQRERHQMGPGDSHREPGGPPIASRGPQREHRNRMGSGDSHRDSGAPPMGPGDLHRDRHQMGTGDSQRESGGSHRERRAMGPGDSHRDPGGPMGPGDSHRESGGLPKSSEGPQRPQMGTGSPHMGSRGQEMPPGGSPNNQRGPPNKHMGPGSHQMDPSKPFGLEKSEIDANLDMDEEEIQPHHSPAGPPFFRGRGFPRGRGPRTRMRGARGAGRGGWRGSSNH